MSTKTNKKIKRYSVYECCSCFFSRFIFKIGFQFKVYRKKPMFQNVCQHKIKIYFTYNCQSQHYLKADEN